MPEEKKCKDCIYENVIEELKRDSERNSEQHREFYNMFSQHEKTMAISEERYTNLLQSMNRLEGAINNVAQGLEEMKTKPAKRWDSLVTTIISCVATAFVVFILTKLGIG